MAKFNRNEKAEPGEKEAFYANRYVQEPGLGLKLLASLVGASMRPDRERIDRLVDRLISSCNRLPLTGGDERFGKIRQIVQLLKNPLRDRVLHDCAIVGVAGQYSSGKSSLINSLMSIKEKDRELLPVSQNPATSVPAYLLKGEREVITACTSNGQEVNIDNEQLLALSHAFAKTYKVNPAQFMDFVAIEHPDFPLDGIALLDTPGFDKSDAGNEAKFADRERTKNVLKSADHLIWLINSIAGTELGDGDINFLKELKPSGHLTIIVNKARGKPEIELAPDPDNSSALNHIRDTCVKNNINADHVFAYEPWYPHWNNGREKLLSVLKGLKKKQKVGRRQELKATLNSIDREFSSYLTNMYVKEIADINNLVEQSYNPFELSPLVKVSGLMGLERANIRADQKNFSKYSDDIRKWMK